MSTAADVPTRGRDRARQIGPGIVAAATGIGVGDLATSMVAGAEYGIVLLWAVVIGTILKFAMAEGVGRWQLATETTVLRGWRTLGTWTMVYFGVYVVVWGFSYGGAVMSATALPLKALFPDASFNLFAALSGVAGFVLVWFGRYRVLEKLVMVLVGLMFVTVVGTAVLVAPDIPETLTGLIPRMPSGSFVFALGLIGGVGGTITLAAYGMWIRAKGWRTREWLTMMHIDAVTAYVLIGIFVVAMLIVGANMLYAAGLDIQGQEGLTSFGGELEDRFGAWARILFLVGFWATSFTSLLGVWNGVSLFFADFVRNLSEIRAERGASADRSRDDERSPAFRAYLAWLTFPPMLLLFLERPVALVVAYAVLGALFMPFLAGTLLVLLNSKRRVPDGFRNGWLSNVVLAAGLLLFLSLLVRELAGLF